jgi:putative transposase
MPNGAKVDEICRRHGISSATFYTWRKKYGGMEASDPRRLKALEAENAKLKRIVAEQMLDMSAMKELLQNHWLAHSEAQSRGLSDDGARPERAAQLPARRAGAIGAAVPPGAEE